MLTVSDLLHVPYTFDLTEGGIAYACRSLAYAYDRMGGSPVDRLRRMVSGVAVELGFRRYLNDQGIPFKVLDKTPFAHPDRYDVSLGGHRCNLKSFLIARRAQVAGLVQDPALMLKAPALLPLDQFAAEGHKPDDLYIFVFFLGEVTASHEDGQNASAASRPGFLIHPLPDVWSRPAEWVPLENLAIKSECETAITVEIGGRNGKPPAEAGTSLREFVTARLELPPKTRVPVEQGFTSLAYVHAATRPGARIGLHSPSRGEAYIIPPQAWSNIWVYGKEILLAGWLSHEEFRRKAKVLNAGMRTFQYDHTRVKNLLVPMADLNPITPLLRRVKHWEEARQKQ